MLRPTILALLLFSATSHAQSNPVELVQRLGSGSFAQRERAAKELDRLGELALPALEAATRGGDVETQRRAASLLRRIEERTLADTLLKPTPTRFQFKDTTIRSALLEIEKQTALKLRWPNEEWTRRKITVDTGTLPFWQAWATFCKQAGVHESPLLRRFFVNADDTNAFVINDGKTPESSAADARQSMRVQLHPMPAQELRSNPCYFGIEVRAEPRLQLLGVSAITLDSLTRVPGNLSIGDRAELEESFAPLLAKPGSAFKLAGPYVIDGEWHSIRSDGKFTARVVWKRPALKIDRLADAVGKTFTGRDGVTVEVRAATFNEAGELSLKLHVAKLDGLRDADLGPATARTRSGVVTLLGPADIALAQLELHDAAGKPLVREKATYVEKDDGYDLHLVYAAPAKGNVSLTLMCQRIVSVPVTFRAVPE